MSQIAQRSKTRLDPQKMAFLNYYTNPESPTFSNAFRSAIRAGFSESYANRITSPATNSQWIEDWIEENIREYEIIHLAEKNLKDFLSPAETDKKIKADLTKFALERLKKHKYSTRQEHTGAEGEPIFLPSTLLNKNELDQPVIDAEVVDDSPPET